MVSADEGTHVHPDLGNDRGRGDPNRRRVSASASQAVPRSGRASRRNRSSSRSRSFSAKIRSNCSRSKKRRWSSTLLFSANANLGGLTPHPPVGVLRHLGGRLLALDQRPQHRPAGHPKHIADQPGEFDVGTLQQLDQPVALRCMKLRQLGECQGSCRLNSVTISPIDDAAGLAA